MPKYLVAIHHPLNYDGSTEPPEMHKAIDDLNDDMVAAGIRVFVGGLMSENLAKSLVAQTDGEILVTDGPFLETKELIGGFWVLDLPNIDEAVEWGRKAVKACRTPVEVRPFGGTG